MRWNIEINTMRESFRRSVARSFDRWQQMSHVHSRRYRCCSYRLHRGTGTCDGTSNRLPVLLLVGRLLLEHSGVDDLTPLPAICCETPGRVNAGAEGLDVPGHGPQPCITRTSSRSSPSCRRVAHCSYHDHVVFLI